MARRLRFSELVDVANGEAITLPANSTFSGQTIGAGTITLAAGQNLAMSSTSDIAVNTDKFTVAGASGNTAVGGTLAVTGAITSASTVTMATDKKILLRDSAISLSSANDGYMDIAADTAVRVATPIVVQTSTSATALVCWPNGATNPSLVVDNSTASSATWVKIKAAAATGWVAVSVLSSGTDEPLTIDAKGAGLVSLGATSTGGVRANKVLFTDFTEVVAATNVIAASESGSVFFLNHATEFVSTLPAVAAGLHYTFIVTGAPSGASYTITTDSSANIIKGFAVNAAGAAGDTDSADDTINFIDGQAVAGDKVEVYCDGTNWFAYGMCKVAAGITFTTAS